MHIRSYLFCGIWLIGGLAASPKQIAIIIVIDQCGSNLLLRAKPYLTGGIKQLLDNGTVYTHATYPHGKPQTAVGHSSLSTGTLPSYHGWIGNTWLTDGERIKCDAASVEHAAVFSPHGHYNYGRSGHYLMVDTLADKLTLMRRSYAENAAATISFKSRAAIGLIGHTGLPIWFDPTTALFTTSKAYTDHIPEWLTRLNNSYKIPTRIHWQPFYPAGHRAYAFPFADTYSYANHAPLFGITQPIATNTPKPYATWAMTPEAQRRLLDYARALIKQYYDTTTGSLFIGVSLSGLDKLGHLFGLESREVLDMLYHIDDALKTFIDDIQTYCAQSTITWVLTADHGATPLYEYVKARGISFARRIDEDTLISDINAHLQSLNMPPLVVSIREPHIYFDQAALEKLTQKQRTQIINKTIAYLQRKDWIIGAFTPTDLVHRSYYAREPRAFLTNAIFPNRSGDILFLTQPYVAVTQYKKGSGHASPYTNDTYVPLMVYQNGLTKAQHIHTPVYPQQLAPTLAQILQAPRPSAAFFETLPGISV